MSAKSYMVGDYVSYTSEYYNGRGGYGRTTNYGCIVEELSSGSFAAVKQYGGQIWYGIKPTGKIEEATFMKNFSIYEEFAEELLKNISKLPENLRNFFENKRQERIENIKEKVKKFAEKEILQYTNKGYKMSIETFYIEWYVYYILRSYEPHRIYQTLTYCYGANEELQDFMKKNVDFMINMQFLGKEGDEFMSFLIEEKLLEYKYEIGKIDANEFMERVFHMRIKKLEYKLKFKIKIAEYLIKVKFSRERENYEFEMSSSNLFGTKFVFPYKYNSNPVNKSSRCHKTIKFNDSDSMWKKILKNDKKNDKLIQVNEIKNFNCIIKYENIPNSKYDSKLLQVLNSENNKILYENEIKFASNYRIIFNNNYICSKKCRKYEVFDLEKKKSNIIDHWSEHSEIFFDTSNKFLIFRDTFSNSSTSTKLTSIYEPRSGKLLGFFEFNYDGMMSIFINEIICEKL
jgi:hypothetical protein